MTKDPYEECLIEEDDFYFEMPDDDFGVYNSRGEQIGSTCSCEDYPCCGH